jgi:hypothetical protein
MRAESNASWMTQRTVVYVSGRILHIRDATVYNEQFFFVRVHRERVINITLGNCCFVVMDEYLHVALHANLKRTTGDLEL